MTSEADDQERGTQPGDASAPGEAALTTGALARRLGVAPTTLRTWERRYGIGPSSREQGRHRRWRPADVARLEQMCRLTAQGIAPAEAARLALAGAPVAREVPAKELGGGGAEPGSTGSGSRSGPHTASGAGSGSGPGSGFSPGSGLGDLGELPLGQVWPESRGLGRAALRLDAAAVQARLRSAVDSYGVVVAWEQIIAPTLHAVGRKWATSGECVVDIEHMLSWHVSTTLRSAVRAPEHEPLLPPVLLACMPDEQHCLAIEALWAALVERGLPTRIFGAAVSAEALESAVRRIGPCAVVLWSQTRRTADLSVVRSLLSLEWGVRGARSHPLVLLAGTGWSSAAHEQGASRLTGLASGLAVLESLFRAVLQSSTAPPRNLPDDSG
ncbi:MerR family transcriptional regulator [Streptomyces sp. TRM66268-LWL]|uniref:MerR family transcriptional regulator n=1 Tax=Streptomyces polyasparticus TaxID=2767826 RepID=A0ABR7SMP5_9ACTN|nr:MerR family transcriptional regulator [Streptomyces polyasparticus]MBC9715842.1 MerR family transcriptional regulator [Streptomyces polyasparticus]